MLSLITITNYSGGNSIVTDPIISNGVVAWEANPTSSTSVPNIFVYNTANGATTQVTHYSGSTNWRLQNLTLSNGLLMWEANPTSATLIANIFVYNVANGATTQVTHYSGSTNWRLQNLILSNGLVVWEANPTSGTAAPDIFVYNTANGSTTQVTHYANSSNWRLENLTVSNGLVMWEANPTSGALIANIFVYNTATGATTQVTNYSGSTNWRLENLSLSNGLLVWDGDPTSGTSVPNIFVYNVATRVTTQVTHYASSGNWRFESLTQSNGLVMWEANPTSATVIANIFVYNTANGATTQVTNYSGSINWRLENLSLSNGLLMWDGDPASGTSVPNIFVYNTATRATTQVTHYASSGNWRFESLTQSNGLVMWEANPTSATVIANIFVYNTATGATTQVTNYNGSINWRLQYLKLSNGVVTWLANTVSGTATPNFFAYNVAAGVTTQITSYSGSNWRIDSPVIANGIMVWLANPTNGTLTPNIYLYDGLILSSATTLASSALTSVYGQAVTFTATVTAGGHPLAGASVAFADGATALGTRLTDGSGRATYTTSTLTTGSHHITASYSGTAGINGSSAGVTQTVNRANLTITADNKSKTYGQANPALTASYAGFVNGDTAAVVSGLMLSTTATMGSGVGSYAITAGGASAANYSISYAAGSLSVTRAPLTITADNKTKVYGSANPTLTASYTGFVNGDTAAVVSGLSLNTTATTGSGVGSYPITASGASAANYSISYVAGTLSITRAALTVTADNKTKVAGNPVPPLTASYSGFVNGDTPASLTSQVTLTTYTGDSAGSYPIVAAGAASPNYTITFVNGTLTVTPAAASSLSVAGFPSPVMAGVAGRFTVVAKDPYGNTAIAYAGMVHFRSSDSQATLPGDYGFTPTDNGVHTFSATLTTAGTQSLTATDTATSTITGSQGGIVVTSAPASQLEVDAAATSTAGQAFDVTVIARDPYGNLDTNYQGTIHFSSQDLYGATLPPDDTFQATDQGSVTFTAGATLYTAGTWDVTATDTSQSAIVGSAQVNVTPAAASQFQVTTSADGASTVAGTPFDVTVTALDPYGNTDTNYQGTVHFSSQDPYGAILPPDYTFQPSDMGTVTLSGGATLYTAGTWDVTATDTNNPAITGTTNLAVTAAAASQFQVTTSADGASTVAGTPFDVTVTALDPYGNIDTNYQGTVTFSSADPYGATLPPDDTFQATDQGSVTFAAGATLYTAGTWDVTATDTTSGITGTDTITVTPAAADHFQISAPTSVAPNTPFDVTVTALDPYGNVDVNYQGTVTFTTTDGDPGVILPADYTFTADDAGVHTFVGGFTLVTEGDQLITATDTVSGITGSATVTVQPSTGPGTGAPGSSSSVRPAMPQSDAVLPVRGGDDIPLPRRELGVAMPSHHAPAARVEAIDQLFLEAAWLG